MQPTENTQAAKLTAAEIARSNGSKSNGPVTALGKSRSSQNAFKTGIYSKRVLLPNEDKEEYLALRAEYFEIFKPQNPFEADLVDDMANARWRIRRMEHHETSNMTIAISCTVKETTWLQSRTQPDHESALAFRRLANKERVLDTLARYEARYRRAFERALKTLQQLRAKSATPLPTYDQIDAAFEIRGNEPASPAGGTKSEGTNQPQERATAA